MRVIVAAQIFSSHDQRLGAVRKSSARAKGQRVVQEMF
jgi:hypothetical protein